MKYRSLSISHNRANKPMSRYYPHTGGVIPSRIIPYPLTHNECASKLFFFFFFFLLRRRPAGIKGESNYFLFSPLKRGTMPTPKHIAHKELYVVHLWLITCPLRYISPPTSSLQTTHKPPQSPHTTADKPPCHTPTRQPYLGS